jgi:hypothetical protein
MSYCGTGAVEAFKRAAARARLVLKAGDRVTLGSSCGGGKQTVTFAHFSDHRGMPDPNGRMFSSRSLDDLSPWNIVKVNGKPVSFRDPDGEAAVEQDTRRRGNERQHFHASVVQARRASFRVVG